MKPFGNEVIKKRFKLPDDSIQAGLRENAYASHDRETFPFCQFSYADVIGWRQRRSLFKRAGHHRGIYLRKIWGDESLHCARGRQRRNRDPPVLDSLTEFRIAGPSLPLGDDLIGYLRNDEKIVKIVLEKRELLNEGEMNQWATLCDNRHGPRSFCGCSSAASSFSSHRSS